MVQPAANPRVTKSNLVYLACWLSDWHSCSLGLEVIMIYSNLDLRQMFASHLVLNTFFPIPCTYFYVRPHMAWLGSHFLSWKRGCRLNFLGLGSSNIYYPLMPRRIKSIWIFHIADADGGKQSQFARASSECAIQYSFVSRLDLRHNDINKHFLNSTYMFAS